MNILKGSGTEKLLAFTPRESMQTLPIPSFKRPYCVTGLPAIWNSVRFLPLCDIYFSTLTVFLTIC